MSLLDDYYSSRKQRHGDDAKPLFSPLDTVCRIEARLGNVTHIEDPDTSGLYA